MILTSEERNTLHHWARRRTIGALAVRSRMVLASADGDGNNVVAEQFGVSPQTIGKWRARFIRRRLDGLNEFGVEEIRFVEPQAADHHASYSPAQKLAARTRDIRTDGAGINGKRHEFESMRQPRKCQQVFLTGRK